MTTVAPIPTYDGQPDHLGPWSVCNGRGWILQRGFPTKHHAWRWIIGPTYQGPRSHKWREPFKPRKRKKRRNR